MKVAIPAALRTKRNMNVNTRQCSRNLEAANYHNVKRIRCCFLLLSMIAFHPSLQAGDRDTFRLVYRFTDTVSGIENLELTSLFATKEVGRFYLMQLPDQLRKKGYLSASVDSVFWGDDAAMVNLFLGKQYKWLSLRVKEVDRSLLDASGYNEKKFNLAVIDPSEIELLKNRVLRKMEDAGYPFASVMLDSLKVKDGAVSAHLLIQKGALYQIDSIRVFGDAIISKKFLHRYLHLPQGIIYQQSKLDQITPMLKRLPYLQEEQPWQLNMLGAGSVLDLYLKNKKSSQLNGFLGFLPASDQLGGNKMLLTGDLNIRLINSFGKGESLFLLFQQIQFKSPRLQMSYQHPYIGGSAWGLDLAFDGFRKDSSFLNIRLQAGAQFTFGGNSEGKLFLQQFITTLDYVDTALIRSTRRLPAQLDQRTSFLGIDWSRSNIAGILSPRKGTQFQITSMAGIRRIRPNNSITSIKTADNSSFDYASLYDSVKLRDLTFRIQANIAQFFSVSKTGVVKTSLRAGLVQNSNLFRNELFQIGGLQLMRGFDDESIFASYYSVLSLEYRLLTGPSSFLYVFTDAGHIQNQTLSRKFKTFLGTGLGTAFETKAGMFNVAFAVGGGGGISMNLRQSKIHLGYINRF